MNISNNTLSHNTQLKSYSSPPIKKDQDNQFVANTLISNKGFGAYAYVFGISDGIYADDSAYVLSISSAGLNIYFKYLKQNPNPVAIATDEDIQLMKQVHKKFTTTNNLDNNSN